MNPVLPGWSVVRRIGKCGAPMQNLSRDYIVVHKWRLIVLYAVGWSGAEHARDLFSDESFGASPFWSRNALDSSRLLHQ